VAKFNEITMNSITGEPVKFSGFKGKLVLVVNVASQ
jgi:glutathione peroxidase-family protein